MGKTQICGAGVVLGFFALQASATVITFTGGNVTRLDTSVQTTNNTVVWDDVDYYEEGGYRLDFLPNAGSGGFATHVGNYYPAFNDVIHSHWATGNYGGVMSVEITKVGGGPFDLNYFILTSNTSVGGGLATGTEMAFIEGFNTNVSTGAALLLPSEDWGFPATQIFLGPAFDNVDKVVFNVQSPVDCFGMDEFYINEEFPEPGSAGLLVGALGIIGLRRRPRT
ncbi:MAG: PEP-CTERM sorting domain-containing protein [Tepidisphaeraceae bacterium]